MMLRRLLCQQFLDQPTALQACDDCIALSLVDHILAPVSPTPSTRQPDVDSKHRRNARACDSAGSTVSAPKQWIEPSCVTTNSRSQAASRLVGSAGSSLFQTTEACLALITIELNGEKIATAVSVQPSSRLDQRPCFQLFPGKRRFQLPQFRRIPARGLNIVSVEVLVVERSLRIFQVVCKKRSRCRFRTRPNRQSPNGNPVRARTCTETVALRTNRPSDCSSLLARLCRRTPSGWRSRDRL